MVDAEVQSQLIAQLHILTLPKQQRVLEYARSLADSPPSSSGKDFLEMCGSLSAEDAKEMMSAIEEECERIDPDAWK